MKIENIKLLTESREDFFSYIDLFYSFNIFSGPSIYFHKRVINLIRNNDDYKGLFNKEIFIELIYATLVSWGMHKMGSKGPKLKRFELFKDSIMDNAKDLVELKKYKIERISINEREIVKSKLISILKRLDIMEGVSYIVGSSKTLHHLLPDLVPPIDREYTFKFFYGHNIYDPAKEGEVFGEIFERYWSICKKLDLGEKDFINQKEFTTSIPKLIDNAIIGFVKSYK